MAGYGKRLRPQSSITPKPLMTVKGQSMVERIIAKFTHTLPKSISDGIFILGPGFDHRAYDILESVCAKYDIQPHYVIQEQPLGTAHAVMCAQNFLEGEGVVVYADTVFDMDSIATFGDSDVVAWVKEVSDPSRFGVAVRDQERIVAFVEKPQELISNEALIGIYYIQNLNQLKSAIKTLFDGHLCGKDGEYYLTDAFDHMLKSGLIFSSTTVNAWLDCGTLDAFMDTTCYLLDHERQIGDRPDCPNSIIIEPVYIGENACVTDSIIGPYVSVESGAQITNSIIKNSIIFESATVQDSILKGSMIGAQSTVTGKASQLNIGDHSNLS